MALDKQTKKRDDDTEEGPFLQFEKCDIKDCIYYNEQGYCAFETCRIKNENPMTAVMITKICKVCGNKFATNMNTMAIQICPACLEGFLKAEGHPHDCIMCGKGLDGNPSIFWPVCGKCFSKLKLAANMAHCNHC
jgi:hypothetical protein